MLALVLCVVSAGVNSVKAEIVTTKTPVILTGGKFAECFVPGTYAIEMQGDQHFIAYENENGIEFDESSTMVFDLEETVENGNVRVTFYFSDGTNRQEWWCLGIGQSVDDTSTPYNHNFDESTYWLKKGLKNVWEEKSSLKITKVRIDNFSSNDQTSIYKIQGGTICGKSMTIKNDNAKTFGAYEGEFKATADFTNIFKMENFEVGDYQKLVVKFAEPVPSTGNWKINHNSGYFGLNGLTEYEIPLDGTKINDFTIFNWDVNPASIKISEVYLYKEESTDVKLVFDDYGFATSNIRDLTAEGGLSYDPETGVLTSDGTAGTLTLEFTNPTNLENLNTFDVKRTGNSNIVNKLEFYDENGDLINTWNNAKWSNTGLDYNATNAFKTHNPVKKLVWQAAANAENSGLTLTISAIEWQLKTISAMKGVDLTTLPYKLWSADGDNDATVEGDATPQKNIGVVTGSVVYGSDNINDSKKYVDLTNYKKLIIRGYGNIRLFYNWVNSSGSKPETNWNNNTTTVKTWELDIPAFMAEKGISHFHLVGIKTNWGATLFVESISVLDGTESFDYAISGKGGLKLQSAVEALADETATVIDATGLTNDTRLKETITTANPNCLIVIDNAEKLTNTQNVIADGTCANLVLTDGHPFAVPGDHFTATSASYTTTINATAQAGTLALPFAAAIPEGVKAYTLYYTGNDEATASEVTSIEANVPVLLNGSGEVTFTGADTWVTTAPANGLNTLVGVYEDTTVPTGDYVLQNGDDGVGFYKVSAEDPITINPFRAYLTTWGAGAKVRVVYEAEDATAITSLEAQDVVNETIYNLNGMRISHPTKGIYIKNGKKFIVK